MSKGKAYKATKPAKGKPAKSKVRSQAKLAAQSPRARYIQQTLFDF